MYAGALLLSFRAFSFSFPLLFVVQRRIRLCRCVFFLFTWVRSFSFFTLSILPSSKANSTSSNEISSFNSLSCQSTEGRKEKDRQQSKIGIVSHRCIMSNREEKGRINIVIVIIFHVGHTHSPSRWARPECQKRARVNFFNAVKLKREREKADSSPSAIMKATCVQSNINDRSRKVN